MVWTIRARKDHGSFTLYDRSGTTSDWEKIDNILNMSTTKIIEVQPVAPVGEAVADIEVDIQEDSPTPDQTTEMPLQVGAVDDDSSLHRACALVLCIGTRVWPQAYSTDWLRTQEVALESNEQNNASPVATGTAVIEWCQQVVATAAQRAMEIDAQHVGVGRAYQKAPDLGISSTASELSIKAQPLIEKAKTAKDTIADKWKVSATAQIAVNSVLFSLVFWLTTPPSPYTHTIQSFDERNQVSSNAAAAAAKTKDAVKEGFTKISARVNDGYPSQVSQKVHCDATSEGGESIVAGSVSNTNDVSRSRGISLP